MSSPFSTYFIFGMDRMAVLRHGASTKGRRLHNFEIDFEPIFFHGLHRKNTRLFSGTARTEPWLWLHEKIARRPGLFRQTKVQKLHSRVLAPACNPMTRSPVTSILESPVEKSWTPQLSLPFLTRNGKIPTALPFSSDADVIPSDVFWDFKRCAD